MFLLKRDLDRLRITMDLERVRLDRLVDLDLDRLVRDTGVLLLERDLERPPRRTDLDCDLERRFLRRETERLDLPVDLDLER